MLTCQTRSASAGKHPCRGNSWIWFLLMSLALLFKAPSALAQGSQERAGVVLYWGVVPAAIVAERHDANQMHGQPPADGGQVHHLVVALFDKASGKRIEDAVVRAQLTEIGIADTPAKYLTPMQVNGLTSYGQVFSVVKPGPYKFHVYVKPPGRTSETEFSIAASSPHPETR